MTATSAAHPTLARPGRISTSPDAFWRALLGPAATWRALTIIRSSRVSFQNARAYAAWAGKEFPTEADWEHFARGGHQGAVYTWGDDLRLDDQLMANTWQGPLSVRVHRRQGLGRDVAGREASRRTVMACLMSRAMSGVDRGSVERVTRTAGDSVLRTLVARFERGSTPGPQRRIAPVFARALSALPAGVVFARVRGLVSITQVTNRCRHGADSYGEQAHLRGRKVETGCWPPAPCILPKASGLTP